MNDLHELMNVRNIIEKMNKVHHIKLFEILKINNIPFSENRNGIFFNINSFNNKIIEQINNYIKYVQKQENNLKHTEELKNNFKNEYFKDNKEKKESIIYHNVA